MLVNFGLMSLLLVGAHLLRARVRFLQDWCVPSALLAGAIGFAAGPNGLGWIPFQDPGELKSYPLQLVVLLFATLFLGSRPTGTGGRALRSVADTFFYNLATEFGQYGLALLFGLFVLAPLFPELNVAFALMLPAGFAGGPGTATATAQALQPFGWDDALSVGLTFAMAGLLSGIVGGMVLVNIAVRRGWTRLVRSPHELPEGMRSGFLRAEDQSCLGRETVSPLALDPLAWHLALALAAVGLGYLAYAQLKRWWPAYDVPVFALAMLGGALLQMLLNLIGRGQHVDRAAMAHIGSTAADFLLAFGLVAIEPHIVRTYAAPLIVLIAFGIAYSMAALWFVGRRAYRNFWFERSLFVYGWNTGVVGTGVALVRVVDPRMRTRTLEDYGVAYLFIVVPEVSLTVFLPSLVGAGHALVPALVLTLTAVVLMLWSARNVGWFTPSPTELRAGEREVLDMDSPRPATPPG